MATKLIAISASPENKDTESKQEEVDHIAIDTVPASAAPSSPALESRGERDTTSPEIHNEGVPDEDFQYALSRVAIHSQRLDAAAKLHNATGLVRFRAAAQLILDGIRDRHHRYSWEFLRRRRDFRKQYVSVLARKFGFEEASRLWGKPPPGADEALSEHEQYVKEVAVIDKRFWTSLARLEYRKAGFSDELCDKCRHIVVGVRYICLVCEGESECFCSRTRYLIVWNSPCERV